MSFRAYYDVNVFKYATEFSEDMPAELKKLENDSKKKKLSEAERRRQTELIHAIFSAQVVDVDFVRWKILISDLTLVEASQLGCQLGLATILSKLLQFDLAEELDPGSDSKATEIGRKLRQAGLTKSADLRHAKYAVAGNARHLVTNDCVDLHRTELVPIFKTAPTKLTVHNSRSLVDAYPIET